MFNVDVGEHSSPTLRLLANIESLLREQNTLLKQAFTVSNTNADEDNKNENKANIDEMGRTEILAIIKTFPKGTIKGKYMTMEISELRKQVKEVLKCQEQ